MSKITLNGISGDIFSFSIFGYFVRIMYDRNLLLTDEESLDAR